MKLELKPISDASEVPMAVHGTNKEAWKQICKSLHSRPLVLHYKMGLYRDNIDVDVYSSERRALQDDTKSYTSSAGNP